MQDSNLKYYILVEGAKEGAAAFRLVGDAAKTAAGAVNSTSSAASKGSKNINNLASSTDKAANATNRAAKAQQNYFLHIAKTTVQSALINKLFLEFVDVAGQAIKQVDLMGNFPATMASMGQSTGDANEALQVMRDYVGQIGGNLGDATSMVTRFTSATNDVKAATAIFVGLNNALIAGDSSFEEQRLAAIQFAQALERGRPDMREWRALTQNMSFQLRQVAEAMGYVNANALGEALTTGEESMASFTTALTKLSTGTGDIAQQALVRMQGTQFAFNVLKNTMVQGLAAIIQAFGRSNIVAFFSFLTQVVNVLAQAVVRLINIIGTLINMISALFGGGKIFGGIAGDAQGVADNLGGGADAAGDLADGLGDAGGAAKKLNKSLASFDKMNVLPDKDSGSGSGGSGDAGGAGGAPFTGTEVGALGDLFGGIGGDLQEASIWAKIFAGLLLGLAGNALIKKLFGVNPLKGLIKGFAKAVPLAAKFGGSLAKGLLGKGAGGSGLSGKFAAAGVKSGLALRTGMIAGFGGLKTVLVAVFSGLTGVLKTVVLSPILKFGKFLIPAIIGAFKAVVVAVAGALGVSFGVAAAIVIAIAAVIIGAIYLIWRNWETIWSFMTNTFNTFWGWMTSLWNTLYDIFAGPIKFLLQFTAAVFILIVAVVATALELVFKLFVATFGLIWNLLKAFVKFVWDDVLVPVFNFWVDMWTAIINFVIGVWKFLFNNVLKPVAGWINNNVIQPVFRFFKGLWDKVSGLIRTFASVFKVVLGPLGTWIKTNVIDRISGFFSRLWSGVKSGVQGLINSIKTIMSGLGGIIKTPINGIIDLINRALQGLNNNVKVPDWVPGLGGKGVNFPMIPKLARGGVVSQSTLAMIGENGDEAVVPLENNMEWLDKLAEKINGTNNGTPAQITIQIGEDQITTKMVDLINEKSQMSGRNAIYV